MAFLGRGDFKIFHISILSYSPLSWRGIAYNVPVLCSVPGVPLENDYSTSRSSFLSNSRLFSMVNRIEILGYIHFQIPAVLSQVCLCPGYRFVGAFIFSGGVEWQKKHLSYTSSRILTNAWWTILSLKRATDIIRSLGSVMEKYR